MDRKIGFAASLVCAAGAAAVWPRLTVRQYTLKSRKVHVPFRFVLLSDLHRSRYGTRQRDLLLAVHRARPDAVFLAGDMVPDTARPENTRELLAGLRDCAPVFYVTGNHEQRCGRADLARKWMRAYGVSVLAGRSVSLQKEGEEISLCGIDDPDVDFYGRSAWLSQLEHCAADRREDVFTLLLSHRPELFPLYAARGFDLTVCGHTHGGQVRIPGLVNGLYAPNQGVFPRYAGGLYQCGESAMVVSRGLDKNRLPRFCNPPECVAIDVLPAFSGKEIP